MTMTIRRVTSAENNTSTKKGKLKLLNGVSSDLDLKNIKYYILVHMYNSLTNRNNGGSKYYKTLF